jgi:hypothetical protein
MFNYDRKADIYEAYIQGVYTNWCARRLLLYACYMRSAHYSSAERYKNADTIMARSLSKNKRDVIEFSMVLRGCGPARPTAAARQHAPRTVTACKITLCVIQGGKTNFNFTNFNLYK